MPTGLQSINVYCRSLCSHPPLLLKHSWHICRWSQNPAVADVLMNRMLLPYKLFTNAMKENLSVTMMNPFTTVMKVFDLSLQVKNPPNNPVQWQSSGFNN